MFCIFMIVLAFALIRLFTSIWLQIWLDDGDGSHHAGLVVQQYTHKLQHPNIATYSEITTFSRNQTKLQVFFKLQLLRSCNVLLSTDVL